MKDTVKVWSRPEAEVAKTFDGIRPRNLTRPATIHSYPGLLGTASCEVSGQRTLKRAVGLA
jgi:hypothetical protein